MRFEIFIVITLIAINAIGIIITWWVVSGQTSTRLKLWFSAMTIFMLLWANFSYLGSTVSDLSKSLLFYRLNWAAVSLFLPSFFYFFIIYFLEKGKNYKILALGIFVFSIILAIVSMFTNLIISNVDKQSWGNEIIFGSLSIIFNIFSALVALLVIYFGLSSFRKQSVEMKSKIQYFLMGVLVFIFANLIFNVGAQVFFGSVRYQVLGDFSSVFLLGFTAYAVVKHNLFDVRVFATEALTVLIWAVLFSKLFISQDYTEIVVDSVVLLITIFFGVLLIRSVKNEIAHRQELELLTKKLKELDAQKDEFVSVAAHELRAPMTAIKGYVSLVLEGDTGQIPDQTREFLTDAFESNDRLIRLVNNMLNVNRIEEGRLVFQMGQVSLKKVVTDVHSEYKHEADRKNLEFIITFPVNLKDLVYVDKDRIYEVVSNLVSNAIKYTDHGKVDIVVTNPNQQTVRVEVKDTGKGISKDEQAKLFQKFQRATSSSGKTIGTGLGLYISKLLVNKFGGKIGLVSEHGKGSNFWFELPLAETHN